MTTEQTHLAVFTGSRIGPRGQAWNALPPAVIVVRAASHETAARKFEGQPHFTIFPGDAIEVMPILPVPQR